MSFFDNKTDVISIELTQYGKFLLSNGKFKPVYYDFFDNDIIYDVEAAGITELRNNIQQRIKNETPYLKPQYTFSGVETSLKTQIELKKQLQNQIVKNGKPVDEIMFVQQAQEKIYFSAYPLGTSDLDEKYPSLNITFYNSKINNILPYKNLETYIVHTPQINLAPIDCVTSVIKNEEKPQRSESEIQNNLALESSDIRELDTYKTSLFSDSTYIQLKNGSILLQIEENNINKLNQEFEIEIFEVSSSSDGQEIYKPLKFNLDPSITNNSNYVEHFFEIKVDDEIDDELFKNTDLQLPIPKIIP